VAKHGLRVLGDGKLDRALHVTAHYFTESAKEKIVKAGGSAEVIVP
jgi:large subunit ribosomal protein L15